MRLAPILIQEGRKDDLRKKYESKFSDYPDMLDYALGHPFLSETNFKYGDFLLKYLHPNFSIDELMSMIDYLKDFHRFQPSLEEKDINRYDYVGLQSIIDSHKEKSKSYKSKLSEEDAEAKKLYDDNNILIVRPLTYKASCKYGAGTQWCTTMAGQPSYFESHTAENQELYYIIFKKYDRSNKFYKIAVHITPTEEVWYDSTDLRLTNREKEVLKLAAPKIEQTIRNDYEESMKNKNVAFFRKLFDFDNYAFFDVSETFKTKHRIGLEFQKPELIPDMPGHAMMELNISVDEENIDQYHVMITYEIKNAVYFDIGYSGDNFEIEPEFDFDLENVSTSWRLATGFLNKLDPGIIKRVFDELCYQIEKQVVYRMKSTPEFMSSIHGGPVWNPDRFNYGYTFQKNAGMVKKLVDWLDAGKTGTKLDFLVDIGGLKRKDIKGKPYYSHTNRNDWNIPSAFRGQQSSFFNSAKLAGILDYDKKGTKYILKKGPNFENFKEGKLKAL